MELILEKIWKKVVKKKNCGKNLEKKLILPWWVKNEEKKLKKANVQNLQIGILLYL
jgi:hypothetical protein